MALNVLDFTRYAQTQKAQVIGQSIGLPIPFTICAFIGMAVTGAGYVLYGEVLWDPADLLSHLGTPWLRCVSGIVLGITILAINLTANVVSPANDFANLAPTRLGFRAGGFITCGLGLLLMPWKLLANAEDFIFAWLLGYGSVLGAILGIMLCDYYLLRRRELNVPALYDMGPGSEYYYTKGFNLVAAIVTLVSIAPAAPGFLVRVHVIEENSIPAGLLSLYDYSFFFACLSACVLYLVGTKAVQRYSTYKTRHYTGLEQMDISTITADVTVEKLDV